jgi:hypothetical protein
MRYFKPLLIAASLSLAAVWAAPAMAYGHYYHGGPRVGLVIGAGFGPWYSPYYYGGPYGYGYPYGYSPYYAPVVVSPPAPTTYVEQGQSAGGSSQLQPAQQGGSWYYCADPQGYYPYVQQCRNGWQRVSPTPQQ